MPYRVLLLICVLTFVSIGCGEGEFEQIDSNAPEGDDFLGDGQALLKGVETSERSEIGKLLFGGGLCTATLITPRVAISARHCVDWRTELQAERAKSFDARVVFEHGQSSTTFPVIAFESYSKGGPVPDTISNKAGAYLKTGADYFLSDDVAVLLLDRDVPSEVAKPTPLVDRDIRAGESLTIWGYGCIARDSNGIGSGEKRRYDFIQGKASRNLCPGDSGGPVTLGREGGVRYVNSAYITYEDSGETKDVFGDVLYFQDEINARLKAWGLEAVEPKEEPEAQTWIGTPCEDSNACNFASGDDVAECVTTHEQAKAAFCSIGCDGYCPDLTGNAPTFCVSLDGQTGSCVSQEHQLNNFCNTDGFEPRQMTRFVGTSGAPSATRTVCLPTHPDAQPEPEPQPLPQDTIPGAPQNLAPDSIVTTQYVDMRWDAVSGASLYKVDFYYYDGNGWQTYASWDSDGPGLRTWPALPEHSYYFNVRACNEAGCSAYSDPSSFYYAP